MIGDELAPADAMAPGRTTLAAIDITAAITASGRELIRIDGFPLIPFTKPPSIDIPP
jgi:hypothetical protein